MKFLLRCALPAVMLGACGQVEAPNAENSVTGVVTRIEDRVPMDGGVTIDVQPDVGAPDVLFMPSLFTFPPPPPERQEVYRIIQQLRVGSRVTATGVRTESGLEIEKLTIIRR